MNLINQYNYPQAVVEACKAELYKPIADVHRVTELIDSPLIKRLLVKHWDELTVDVDEMVYSSLFGTAWHKFLSSFEVDAMIEKRWTIKAPAFEHSVITGQTDIFKIQGSAIEDNKTQSAWAFVFGTPSWERQLNIYAELVEENGYEVNELWINSFLRDWSKYEAMKGKNRNYPTHKFHRVRVPLWDKEKRRDFMHERLSLHINDEDYVCSDEERWRRKTTWAVMKKGVKTARRVLDSEVEAERWIAEKKPQGDISIEKRLGGCVRCQEYCSVRSVCKHKDS
jgi:hypothetical protein